MDKNSRICVFGSGMVGSALVRELHRQGYEKVFNPKHSHLDLTNPIKVEMFYAVNRPEYVFMAAGVVGGIKANMENPAQFIYNNSMMALNVIHYAHRFNVKKLMYFASNCSYPKSASQPMREDCLSTGSFEPTNEFYSQAKMVGIKMCEAYNRQYGCKFFPVLPCNLTGVGDNFDPNSSHLIPALIRKFHEAKVIEADHVDIWGSGLPKREIMNVDDLADACLFLMKNYQDVAPINIGMGYDLPIHVLAQYVKHIVDCDVSLQFDATKPDGIARKFLGSAKIYNMGWRPKHSTFEAIQIAYKYYLEEVLNG